MAYVPGTITNADPAGQLLAAIEAAMFAHATWDKVEDFTLSALPYSVWKNNGSGASANSFGQDYYLVFEKSSTTALRIRICEQYTPAGGTPANARLIKYAKVPTSAVATPNADGSFGVAAGIAPNDTASQGYVGFAGLVTTGFEYYLVLSKDYLRVGVRQGGGNVTVEAGLFDTVLPGAPGPVEPFPLHITVSSTVVPLGSNLQTSVAHGVLTRHPNLPDTTARGYLFGVNHSTGASEIGFMLGGPGNLSGLQSADRFQGAGTILYGIPTLTTNATADASLIGRVRGRFKDMIRVQDDVSGPGLGDDWVLGTDTYINWRVFSSQSVWIKRDVA